MAEYETNKESSDEWYTPPELFAQMDVLFDLDPCSPICQPGRVHWVPSVMAYTKEDDGLSQEWYGFVFMNPPFGGRHSHLPWLDKFIAHKNGVGVVRAYTSAGWFHEYIPKMDAICFPKGKTKFVRPDGSIGKSPGHGVVFFAMGERGVKAIQNIPGLYFVIG